MISDFEAKPRYRFAPLREILKKNYTSDDLRVITSDLGLNWEDLPGDSHNTKVTELISLTYQEGKEKELQNILQERSNLEV